MANGGRPAGRLLKQSDRGPMFTKRIGVLTSGGAWPGMNGVLRGVTKAADKLDWQGLGFRDGFEGLLPPSQFMILDRATTAGIMQQGGTILGTTNKGHFVAKMGSGEKIMIPSDIVDKARATLEELGVQGRVGIGGARWRRTAVPLFNLGFPIIGGPKTIDN